MTIGFFYLFLVGSLFPGFFLFNFGKDAYEDYKRTGKFSMDILIGNPILFFLSLAAFVALLAMAFYCRSVAV